MIKIYCVFCGAEGYTRKNQGSAFQHSDGSITSLWGVRFDHSYDCPLYSRQYRCNYHSEKEAIEAHIPDFNWLGEAISGEMRTSNDCCKHIPIETTLSSRERDSLLYGHHPKCEKQKVFIAIKEKETCELLYVIREQEFLDLLADNVGADYLVEPVSLSEKQYNDMEEFKGF